MAEEERLALQQSCLFVLVCVVRVQHFCLVIVVQY